MQTHQLTVDKALLDIIARAAPPHERADTRHFAPAPEQDEAALQARHAAWAKALGGDDPAQLETLLDAVGLDRAAYLPGLADVVVADPEQLPPWAVTLARLLDADGPQAKANDVFGPFTALAHEELRALDPGGALLSEPALEQSLELLRRRLLSATGQVLRYELLASGIRPGPGHETVASYGKLGGTQEDWLRRFTLYPALAYVVATVYRNWYGSFAELMARLADDRQLLAERLLGGQRPGPVVELKGDAGDLHNHGRSVVLLTFAGGGRAVYKPKDLRIAAAYMELVAQLNRGGLPLALPTRTILTRPGYAWEEYVAPAPCADAAQVARFYTRMGMTIRLLQLLEARDFWLDNLLACGEQPVFVDLEMLLQPRARRGTEGTAAQREARRRMEESVAYLGAIALPMVIAPGVRAEDLGALSVKRRFLSPFKSAAHAGQGRPQANDFLSWEHPEHIPQLLDTPVDATNYLDAILTGYSSMHACLLANRAALLAPDSPLQRMQRCPVRYIRRDTWTNYKILQASLAPARLRDGVRREQFLVNLLRGLDPVDRRPQEFAVVQHEIADLRGCDVPFFIATPIERSVCGVDGTPVADYFDEPAAPRLAARMAELEHFDLGRERDLLAACFATGHRPPTPAPVVPRSAGAEPPPWLDLAVAVGDTILAEGIGSDADRAWIGLTYFPLGDTYVAEVLPADLLSGTCGLALLFAELHRATALARFRSGAYGALAATQQFIAQVPAWTETIRRQRAQGSLLPFACGGLIGVGSQIYTLARCARALDEPGLAEQARALLMALPLADLCAIGPADLVCGTAGLLLAAVACLDQDAPPQLVERALLLAEHLLHARRADGALPPSPYPPEAIALDGVPDGSAGLALGLARLRRHGLLPRELNQLAVELGPAQGQGATRGEVGRLLGRLELLLLTGEGDAGLSADLEAFLARETGRRSSADLLDRAELALAGLAATGGQGYRATAEAAGRALWQRHETYGSWFPECFAPDRHNLGAVGGVAAVAHCFLRLHAPAATPSLRLLA